MAEIVDFLQKNSQDNENHTIFHGWMSIFYKHDIYQAKLFDSLHKIKGLALRNKKYLKKKR